MYKTISPAVKKIFAFIIFGGLRHITCVESKKIDSNYDTADFIVKKNVIDNFLKLNDLCCEIVKD